MADLYIYPHKRYAHAASTRPIGDGIFVDLDDKNQVIGIEVIKAYALEIDGVDVPLAPGEVLNDN